MRCIMPAFLLLSIAAVSFAEDTDVSGSFGQAVSSSLMELVSSWQALAFMAVLLSAIFVAIGYMLGVSFEIPELKAWAGTEIVQVAANAILIIILVGVILFLDMVVMTIINGAEVGGLHCDPGEPCLKEAVTSEHGYLQDYISGAESGAKSVLANNMAAAAWANRRMGISCITIYCGMLSLSMNLAPHYILDTDRYSILYEYWTGVLSSLHAQKFFVDQISFRVGPLLLAIGIVARSFFVTRKLGGLLIAAAAGVMFFFPLMYIFDWMTLDMVVAGDKGVEDDVRGCPAECGLSAPIAYYYNGTEDAEHLVQLQDTNSIYMRFDVDTNDPPRQLALGEIEYAVGDNDTSDADGRQIYSCYYGDYELCPGQCRDLPYPQSLDICAGVENQTYCAALPEECKVIREVPGAAENPEYLQCPAECKIIPPLKSDCGTDAGDCLSSRFDCRVAQMNNLTWRPTVQKQVEECEMARDCPASNTSAYDSCVYVIPQYGSCDDLCTACPAECRLLNADEANLPAQCFASDEDSPYDPDDPDTWVPLDACNACPGTCKVDVDYIREALDIGNCTSCDYEMRILAPSMPMEYISGDCTIDEESPEYCPIDTNNRAELPSSSCQACLFSEESYLYSPPVNTDCGSLCKPSTKVPSKRSGEYTQVGTEGMVGMQEIQDVSRYMIPAYLLPLFNILATLVFIKGLSVMIGGDIEIPGIQRIF